MAPPSASHKGDQARPETPTYTPYHPPPNGATSSSRFPYDGRGSFTAANGDRYPAKKYQKVLLNVTLTILVMECTERLCYYGITGSIQAYLINFLNYPKAQAAALTSTVTTVVYFTPLLGAYLADAHWGRYRSILYFGLVYLAGVVVISISTYPSVESKVPFLLGLYLLVAIGAGGIKPNVVTFGADQFDISTLEGQKEQQHFFNFFYWVINVGAFFSYSVLAQMALNGMGAIPESYGFFASFTVSAAAWVIAIIAFVVGSKRYIKRAPSGSALSDFLSLFWRTARGTWKGMVVFGSLMGIVLAVLLSCVASFMDDGTALTYITAVIFIIGFFAIVLLNRDPTYVLEAARKEGYLGAVGGQRRERESSVVEVPGGEGERREKRVETPASAQEALDAYQFLRVWSPVFFAVIFWVMYNQMSSNMYMVSCQCNLYIYGDTQLNGSFLNLGDTLAIVIFIPIMEAVGYPMIERLKGSKFTSLQKMFWGMICAMLAMVATAVLESVRKNRPLLVDREPSKCAEGITMSDFSVWWMAIPYCLIGLAEVLISVPLYDLNYVEVPEGVRSTAQALNLFTTSISGGVSAIIPLIFASWVTEDLNNGHMDYLFWFLAGLSAFGAVFFVYVVKDFKYAELPEDGRTLEIGKLPAESSHSFTRKDSYDARLAQPRQSLLSSTKL